MDKDLKRAQSLVPLAYDGRLTDEEYRFIEEAARRYPELRLDLYRYERLGDLYGAVEDVRAPASIEENVISTLQHEGAFKRAIHGIFAPVRRLPIEAVGAAAAALVIFLAVMAYVPSLTHKGKPPTALFDLEKAGPPTLSARVPALPSAGPIGDENVMTGEDVALIAGGTAEKKENAIRSGETVGEKKEKTIPSEETLGVSNPADTRLYCVVPTPAGSMTACVVVTEKASKALLSRRSALPTAPKKEETPRSSILISTSTERDTAPGVLSIRDPDPAGARKEIVEKALTLGGTIRSDEMFWRDEKAKGAKDDSSTTDDVGPEAIDLPPEKIDELFDYVTSRFPEAAGEVERLRSEGDETLLLIDIVPSTE
jgi:hypothetical protein